MEQRPLRLGDILDDYCPRERRVTNHAIVALIEADIKQTRCTTCDAEHVYKGGKAPRRKKPETTGALYKEVLAGISDEAGVAASSAAHNDAAHKEDAADESDTPVEPFEPRQDAVAVAPEPDEVDAQRPDDEPEGPVHRPLIRAQLPRPEGLKVERPLPEFTIRQNNNGRGSNFRGGSGGDMRGKGRNQGGGGAASNNNGHRFGRGPQRNAGGRGGATPGFGRGPGPGGGGQQRSGGPRKRSR